MEGNLKIINLELPYDQLGKIGLNYLGENIGELIILDGLKISKDFCVNLWKLPAGQKIKKEGLGITGLSKLSSTETGDIYLVKKRPTKLTLLLEKYGLYYDFPITVKRPMIEISIRGFAGDINLFCSELDKKDIKYRVTRAMNYITQNNLLSTLTKKQKQALTIALKEGYFKTPRRIDAHALAEKLGIRHTTFLQHLRRAQEKMLERIVYDAP